MSLRVHLRRPARHLEVDPGALRRLVRAMLEGESVERGAVAILLTDDEGLRALNAAHRGRDRATDVLAFPLGEPDETGVVHLGDVAISLERAVAQAPRFGNDAEAELARLLAHGLLHLLGYDHHSPADGRRMKAAERRALGSFRRGSLRAAPRRRAAARARPRARARVRP